MKKGLAGRTFKSESKSKSIAFKSESKSESLEPKSKSKSSKNGLKSGLESKSGLEYYKSVKNYTVNNAAARDGDTGDVNPIISTSWDCGNLFDISKFVYNFL